MRLTEATYAAMAHTVKGRGALFVGGVAAILASTCCLGPLVLLSSPAWAASRTVTLAVSNMTCAACPITVKKALTRVDGVSKAAVDLDKQEAVVTFDDAKTSVTSLIKATTDAGYPSRAKEGK
jgi:mercuric ion binding protein